MAVSRKRREYTDDDRAAVLLALTVSDGNVARSARETGVPEQTVRDWKREWVRNGTPTELLEQAETQAGDFATKVETVRDQALDLLETKLPEMSGRDLTTTVGVLTDKSMRLRGVTTQTVEHKHSLPSGDDVRELVSGFAEAIRDAAVERDGEIIEAEVVEQPALPRGTRAGQEEE